MKGFEKRRVLSLGGVLLSGMVLLSCNSIGYGRRVDQVGDHSFPAAGAVVDDGELKLEILKETMSQFDVKLEEHQILCRGKITSSDAKPFSSEFYEKTFKKYIFDGNIITGNQTVFIKELPFVTAADNKPKGYGEQGYGEKRVWFNFSSVTEPNFSITYHQSLDNYNTIPKYPVELATVTIQGRSYRIYAVYEPLYETVPFFGKGPSSNPLRNMDSDLRQLKNNDQKYQIVNSDKRTIAEVYKHRYQLFDTGDPVTINDGAFCAGLMYTIVNVTYVLETSPQWYK